MIVAIRRKACRLVLGSRSDRQDHPQSSQPNRATAPAFQGDRCECKSRPGPDSLAGLAALGSGPSWLAVDGYQSSGWATAPPCQLGPSHLTHQQKRESIMTQPQFPQQFGAPVQPQQQFPPQGFPQQQYQQPMPVQPGYPAQQYNFPVPPQAQPAPQLAAGSLDDFFGQPTVGGGPALKFPVIGDSHTFTVSRVITKADVQQQTDTRNIPQFFKDGRPKFQMIVPATLPDGSAATWYVKGATREALGAAMTKAGVPGAPQCAPEAGATIRVTYVGDKQNGAGYSPSKLYHVEYARPQGAQSASTTVAQAAAQPMTDTQAEQKFEQAYPQQVHAAAQPQQTPLGAPVQHPPAAPQFDPSAQQTPNYVAQIPQAPAMPPMPDNLTADQQATYAALLAQLGGQPQG